MRTVAALNAEAAEAAAAPSARSTVRSYTTDRPRPRHVALAWVATAAGAAAARRGAAAAPSVKQLRHHLSIDIATGGCTGNQAIDWRCKWHVCHVAWQAFV